MARAGSRAQTGNVRNAITSTLPEEQNVIVAMLKGQVINQILLKLVQAYTIFSEPVTLAKLLALWTRELALLVRFPSKRM